MSPLENQTPDEGNESTNSTEGNIDQHNVTRSIKSLDTNAANIDDILSDVREEINAVLRDFKDAAEIDPRTNAQQEYRQFTSKMQSVDGSIFTEELGTGDSNPALIINTDGISHDPEKLKMRLARAVEVVSNHSDSTRAQLLRVIPGILGRIQSAPEPESPPDTTNTESQETVAATEAEKKGFIQRIKTIDYKKPFRGARKVYDVSTDFYNNRALKPLSFLDPRTWFEKKK